MFKIEVVIEKCHPGANILIILIRRPLSSIKCNSWRVGLLASGEVMPIMGENTWVHCSSYCNWVLITIRQVMKRISSFTAHSQKQCMNPFGLACHSRLFCWNHSNLTGLAHVASTMEKYLNTSPCCLYATFTHGLYPVIGSTLFEQYQTSKTFLNFIPCKQPCTNI